MKRIHASCFGLFAAALVFVGCQGAVLERGATEDDVSTFAAALKNGASPAEACKELSELCNLTGQGCNAFDYFCGEVFDEACTKLEEACDVIPEACDLHQQHCKGGDDPTDPKDPTEPPDSDCCKVAAECLSTMDPNSCMQAAQLCADPSGAAFPTTLPLTDEELMKMKDLYLQVCGDAVQPGDPKDPKDPVDPTGNNCCEVAMNCVNTQDEQKCKSASQICSDQFGYQLPSELPPGMSWEQLEQMIKQVCDAGQLPQKPQPGDPNVPQQCCDLVKSCSASQDTCYEAVKTCADQFNLPVDEIPWKDLESYLPMLEAMCGK